MKTKKPAPNPDYEPTPQEILVLRKYSAARSDVAAVPLLKVLEEDRVTKIKPDHPDIVVGQLLLMDALGATDLAFVDGLLLQLAGAASQHGKVDERLLNFMLSFVKGIKPKDQTEAMLATQMAAVHSAAMTFARRLTNVENIPQQDSAERAFNKLTRTFATQIETLKRYRTGGEQRVTVQHVSVQEGGQAIVGNVTQATREAASHKPRVSPPTLTHPKTLPMDECMVARPDPVRPQAIKTRSNMACLRARQLASERKSGR